MKSMSPGILILGVLAVSFGLVGAYGAKKYLQPVAAPKAAPVVARSVTVPMAIRDLPAGRTVASGDFTSVPLTEEEIRERGLPNEFMTRPSQIVNRTLCAAIQKGEAFSPLSFYPDGIGPSIASQLSPEHRAVTLPFDGSAAEASLITPGAMVDVLFRTSSSTTVPETTMTLLENVKVLAVGRQLQEGAVVKEDNGTVTLSVTPVQSRALKVVEGHGSLTLVLRNGEASLVEDETGPTTLPDLLGIETVSNAFKTEIYRRGQLTTVVHGAEGRQVIRESPYGMPVVGRANSDERRAMPASATPTAASNAKATKPCGCGASSAQSALVKGR